MSNLDNDNESINDINKLLKEFGGTEHALDLIHDEMNKTIHKKNDLKSIKIEDFDFCHEETK